MQPGNENSRFAPLPHRVIPAVILIVVGVLFLLDNLNIVPFEDVWRFWPVALIAVGIFLLIDRTALRFNLGRYRSGEYPGAYDGGQRIREAAVFGGGKRRVTSQAFTGGKVDAVFSGYQIDLRDAAMQGDSATLDINAVFGGVEVKIPDTWTAIVHGTGVFGAFTDSTHQPDPMRTPNPKRLFVRGGAVFGGVEIRN